MFSVELDAGLVVGLWEPNRCTVARTLCSTGQQPVTIEGSIKERDNDRGIHKSHSGRRWSESYVRLTGNHQPALMSTWGTRRRVYATTLHPRGLFGDV
jgi:hypothetical protein